MLQRLFVLLLLVALMALPVFAQTDPVPNIEPHPEYPADLTSAYAVAAPICITNEWDVLHPDGVGELIPMTFDVYIARAGAAFVVVRLQPGACAPTMVYVLENTYPQFSAVVDTDAADQYVAIAEQFAATGVPLVITLFDSDTSRLLADHAGPVGNAVETACAVAAQLVPLFAPHVGGWQITTSRLADPTWIGRVSECVSDADPYDRPIFQ